MQLNLSLYLPSEKSVSDLEFFSSDLFKINLIWSPREYARLGNCSWADLPHLLQIFPMSKIELDGLFTEKELDLLIIKIEKLKLTNQTTFRVKDLGLLYYLKKSSAHHLEFLGETFNNSYSLKSIENFCGSQLKSITLSNEYSYEMIAAAKVLINTPLEYLLFGPNLIFYSPRQLLSPLLSAKDADQEKNISGPEGKNTSELRMLAHSEESPHKGFKLHQGELGTIMFHPKYLNNLKEIKGLIRAGIHHFKIDLRLLNHSSFILKYLEDCRHVDELESLRLEDFPNFNGYLHKNKSDKIFPKLKNNIYSQFEAEGHDCVGKCIDVRKGKYILIESESGRQFPSNEKILILNPDGKQVRVTLGDHQKITSGEEKTILKLNFIKGVSPMSRLYRVFDH